MDTDHRQRMTPWRTLCLEAPTLLDETTTIEGTSGEGGSGGAAAGTGNAGLVGAPGESGKAQKLLAF